MVRDPGRLFGIVAGLVRRTWLSPGVGSARRERTPAGGRARREVRSLDEVALEGLRRDTGLLGERPRRRDLSPFAGTWAEDLPFVVLGELRAGFAVGTQGASNERGLARFLTLPGVTVLHSSDDTARQYAMLYRQLRVQGTPVPTNDLWIAALVIEHDLDLCSRDAHFERLPQLRIV